MRAVAALLVLLLLVGSAPLIDGLGHGRETAVADVLDVDLDGLDAPPHDVAHPAVEEPVAAAPVLIATDARTLPRSSALLARRGLPLRL